jgi:hypothetical protein
MRAFIGAGSPPGQNVSFIDIPDSAAALRHDARTGSGREKIDSKVRSHER